MRYLVPALALTVISCGSFSLSSRTQPAPRYETRTIQDSNGTGTFYMGREIAQVMGSGGIELLDRALRDTEEHPAQVLDALQLYSGEVVAELGAGSGYFTLRMAPKVRGRNPDVR